MGQGQTQLGHAEGPRALDVFRLLHREHGGADDAAVERNVHHGHRDHAVDEPGAEGGDDGHGEQEVGKGHQRVDGAHDELVDPAADEAREEAAERSRERGQSGGGQPHHERDAGAEE